MTGINLHLDPTIGSIFIGVIFAVMLYAGTCAQSVYYYRRYSNDSMVLKGLVFFLWLLDTSSTLLVIQVLWFFTVRSHGSPFALLAVPVEFTAEYMFTTFIIYVVQWCIVSSSIKSGVDYRIKYFLTITGLLLATISLGALRRRHRAGLRTVPASIQLVTAIVADIYITVSLCLILKEVKTGVSQTDSLLNRLIMYSMNRGILSAMNARQHLAEQSARTIELGNLSSDSETPSSVLQLEANLGKPKAAPVPIS
ncbi:hypothetical protein A0H81_01380 [Grifola frondosa]|uniref:DUF6534 domain-containing protein n=1 Tax=Grifola frondosa TaxID=5627 RepID=A0A1C7MTI3_GRIFR|nr:hypothetical protein A0H81_01380 [Grifola frondosa]